MQMIQLRKILEAKGISFSDAGTKLFPGVRYPYMAIKRVMDGDAELATPQIEKLSEITKIPVGFLFSKNDWQASATENKLIFSAGEYLAELDTETQQLKISENGELFHVSTIGIKGLALTDYLDYITKLILNK